MEHNRDLIITISSDRLVCTVSNTTLQLSLSQPWLECEEILYFSFKNYDVLMLYAKLDYLSMNSLTCNLFILSDHNINKYNNNNTICYYR